MAKNATQIHVLYNLMKAAGSKGVSRKDVSKALGVKENSVPVYFHWIKKKFNADVEVTKNGRQVVAWKLLNPDQTHTYNVTKTKAVTKPVKVAKKVTNVKATKKATKKAASENTPILDKDMKIAEITDNELNDIKSSLGLL